MLPWASWSVGLAVVFGVFEVVAGERGGEQAVAGGGVSVAAMPDGDTTGAVFHAEDVAGGVVGVGLQVISLGLGVLGVGDGGEAFGGGLREGVVFATCRLGQAVEGVVGEGLGGVGVGVVEKDAGLGEVADPGDVADGVVVVAEILDAAEVGIAVRALGVDPPDAEGGGIVLEVCKNVIGGVDAQALAAGVVGDGGDDVSGGAGAADLDGEGRDEAAGAVGLLGDALVGGGVGDDAPEGVVGPGGLKGLGVEQGVGGVVDVLRDSFQNEVAPVGGGGVVGGEAAGLLEEVLFKIVGVEDELTGGVVVGVDLTAVVGSVGELAEALAVDGALAEELVVGVVLDVGVGGAAYGVVGPAESVLAGVPEAERGSEDVREGPAGSRVGGFGVELEPAGGSGRRCFRAGR
jgi:hypothetical protein